MKDYFDGDIKKLIEENKWIKQFLEGQGYCIICNHDDPLDLENHHMGAKTNSELIVSLCRNCHGRISRKQRYWPKGWSKKNKSQMEKDGFLIYGISEILKMTAQRILDGNAHG